MRSVPLSKRKPPHKGQEKEAGRAVTVRRKAPGRGRPGQLSKVEMILAEYTRGTQPLMVTPGGPSRQEQAELPTDLEDLSFQKANMDRRTPMTSCSGGEAKHREHTVTLCGKSTDRHTYADQRLPWVGQAVC